MNQTWIITGCSSGLGTSLAPEALEQCENVIVTAGNPETLHDFSSRYHDYSETAGRRKVKLENPEDSGMSGWGDKQKAAKAIIEAVQMCERPFRLLLGSLAVKMDEEFVETRKTEIEKFKKLSESTD